MAGGDAAGVVTELTLVAGEPARTSGQAAAVVIVVLIAEGAGLALTPAVAQLAGAYSRSLGVVVLAVAATVGEHDHSGGLTARGQQPEREARNSERKRALFYCREYSKHHDYLAPARADTPRTGLSDHPILNGMQVQCPAPGLL